MHRGRCVLVVCHCLLNTNAKVAPLATAPGALLGVLEPFLRDGVGLMQLPCPETAYLGCNRWGMTREQYDHPAYRRACAGMVQPVVDQLQALVRDGCTVLAVLGVDGSPSCGVFQTCEGYGGGEIADPQIRAQAAHAARLVPGRGVFLDVLHAMLAEAGIIPPYWAVDEHAPTAIRTE
ncbi:MAG: hypothetical protein LDL27_03460 [Desulfovibrio sp.]|nr:hypothetical protein [Desulfovibrio sp.]